MFHVLSYVLFNFLSYISLLFSNLLSFLFSNLLLFFLFDNLSYSISDSTFDIYVIRHFYFILFAFYSLSYYLFYFPFCILLPILSLNLCSVLFSILFLFYFRLLSFLFYLPLNFLDSKPVPTRTTTSKVSLSPPPLPSLTTAAVMQRPRGRGAVVLQPTGLDRIFCSRRLWVALPSLTSAARMQQPRGRGFAMLFLDFRLS